MSSRHAALIGAMVIDAKSLSVSILCASITRGSNEHAPVPAFWEKGYTTSPLRTDYSQQLGRPISKPAQTKIDIARTTNGHQTTNRWNVVSPASVAARKLSSLWL